MEITELFAAFSDPSKVHGLSDLEILWASLFTTLLGMGITFVALIALQYLIGLFKKIAQLEEKPPVPARKNVSASTKKKVDPVRSPEDGLVAAITASIAMMLETPASNIRIRSFRKIENASSAWSRVGIYEQMRNSLW